LLFEALNCPWAAIFFPTRFDEVPFNARSVNPFTNMISWNRKFQAPDSVESSAGLLFVITPKEKTGCLGLSSHSPEGRASGSTIQINTAISIGATHPMLEVLP
jgi:hypothetical protein